MSESEPTPPESDPVTITPSEDDSAGEEAAAGESSQSTSGADETAGASAEPADIDPEEVSE